MTPTEPFVTSDHKIKGKNVKEYIKLLEEIPYQYVRILGGGSEGLVFLAKDKIKGGLVAIKICVYNDGYNNGETVYWEQIKHNNCLKLLNKIIKENVVYYVMEYAENRTLYDWIKRTWRCQNCKPENIPNEELLKLWSRQQADAIEHLHNIGLYHLDIKPDNIFLDGNWNIKLGDFGYSRLKNEPSFRLGCPRYRPPEILVTRKSRMPRNLNLEKIDAWSFGATLLEMVSGKLISGKEFSDTDINNSNCHKNIRVNFPKLHHLEIPFDGALDLIIQLLQPNPKRRPTVKEIKDHPWLQMEKEDATEDGSWTEDHVTKFANWGEKWPFGC